MANVDDDGGVNVAYNILTVWLVEQPWNPFGMLDRCSVSFEWELERDSIGLSPSLMIISRVTSSIGKS